MRDVANLMRIGGRTCTRGRAGRTGTARSHARIAEHVEGGAMEQMTSATIFKSTYLTPPPQDHYMYSPCRVARLAILSPNLAKLAKFGPPPAKFIFDF